jgi:hypothetical protein
MSTPNPLAYHVYNGILRLIAARQESSLEFTDNTGTLCGVLMMADPSPSGAFSSAEVLAAYSYFSQKPGCFDGATITVVGFIAIPPGGTQPILHVVRA